MKTFVLFNIFVELWYIFFQDYFIEVQNKYFVILLLLLLLISYWINVLICFPKNNTDLLNGSLPCFAFLPLSSFCTFPHRPRRCWPSHCPAGKISVLMPPGCPTQWYPWLRVCGLQCQSYQSPRLRWSTVTGLVSHRRECTTINIHISCMCKCYFFCLRAT